MAQPGTRKPIHLELVGLQTPRERIWKQVRTLRRFTLLELQDAIKPLVVYSTVEKYIEALVRSGHVKTEHDRRPKKQGHHYTAQVYTLAQDAFDAPRVNGKGEATLTPGLVKLAMWRAMKALKEFDFRDIQRAASTADHTVAERTVQKYLWALAKAGYLQACSVRSNGHPTRYRLVRDTGAHAPLLTRRNTVFDRNTGEFTWQETAQEVCDALEE